MTIHLYNFVLPSNNDSNTENNHHSCFHSNTCCGCTLFTIKIPGYDLSFLPPFYASINGLTAITLILAVVAIKGGNKKRHELLMKTSIALSLVFLVCYVLYHITSETTYFGDSNKDGMLSADEKGALGVIKYVYYFILASHIFLSIAVIPLVLITYVRAITKLFPAHKKIARITFPLWLYIAITGVVIYIMISPYYAS